MNKHTLYYDAPAANWNEALPLGNGRLGAMMYSGAILDRISLSEAKTKLVAQMLKELGSEKKTLLVLPGKEDKIVRASKNIPTVKDAYVNTLNVYDILNADKIVIEKDAMEKIQEVYA